MPVLRKNGRRLLFIHIPKAGGTSVEHFFLQNNWQMDFFDGGGEDSINSFCLCSPQHMHMSMLKSIFRFDAFDEIFTFVRNPKARLVSEYKWRVKYLNEKKIFEDWYNDSFNLYERNPYALDNHLRPQVEFIDPSVKVLKLENGIDKGLASLFDELDLDMSKLKVAMSSNREVINLSSEIEKHLYDFYKDDFKYLGYD